MPSVVTCPSCSRQLRVPDTLQSQQVQCPSCRTAFVAPRGAAPPAEPVLLAERPKLPPQRPAALPVGPDPLLAAKTAAAARTRAPGIALAVLGSLEILGALLTLLCGGIGLVGALEKANQDDAGGLVVLLLAAALAVPRGLLLLTGGIRLQRVQSYPLVLISVGVALLPCNPCFLVGAPLGVWALVILFDAEVRRGFA